MNTPSREQLQESLKEARLSKRLIRDIRYIPEEIAHPDERDFLAISTKSGNEGVLLYKDTLLTYELQRRRPNKNGRIEAVICDICATWQRGTNSAIITFKKSDKATVSHLVCADLDCSLHVRDVTAASALSRVQLREHISPQARIIRLNERLERMIG